LLVFCQFLSFSLYGYKALSIDLYCEIYPEVADRHPIAIEQWQEWFEKWEIYLRSQQAIAEGEYELSLTITDDLTIQKLNLQYRQLDKPEIPIDDSDYVEPTCWGDIIISQTTAIRQAEERGHSLIYELAWLAAHGLLHLLGWDHPDDASLEEMLKHQDLMLRLISL
jgi:probable rRNA maturation factor